MSKNPLLLLIVSSGMLMSCGGNSSSQPTKTSEAASITSTIETPDTAEKTSEIVETTVVLESSEEVETEETVATSLSASTSKVSTSYSDPWADMFSDWTVEIPDYDYEKYSIQIGGDIKSIPDRRWNPEAAHEQQCFIASEADHNRYDLTIALQAGDIVMFFFDYSWDRVIGYDGINWDYDESIVNYDSYVTDEFTGEDISNKFVEIRIIQDATFTFSYFAFGASLDGMITGMALTGLEA